MQSLRRKYCWKREELLGLSPCRTGEGTCRGSWGSDIGRREAGPQEKRGEERIIDCANMTAGQRRPKTARVTYQGRGGGQVTRLHCHSLENVLLHSQEDPLSTPPHGRQSHVEYSWCSCYLFVVLEGGGSHCWPKLASSSLCSTSCPQTCHPPALAPKVGYQACTTMHSSHSGLFFNIVANIANMNKNMY